ncbi:hypothetical protein JCM6882_008739 [Rhodosporidiobolus microsporus]
MADPQPSISTDPPSPRSLRLAVIGCSHGTLDDIYASVLRADEEALKKGEAASDVVICCGDFQAMRNTSDLETMACPVKFRALGQFHSYYSGEKVAPKLTIVIGGNHEASGYMWELYHGGWLAPNIYFLGFAGSVLVDGWLRITGASGIWRGCDWRKGHYETVPFDDRTIRSVYHIREYDVARLLQLKNRIAASSSSSSSNAAVDVFLSHDWPLGIEQHGDTGALIREKPFFRDEINSNSLGSPPLHALLTSLKPRYWFSAHLHVKFAALYWHDGRGTRVRQQHRQQQQRSQQGGQQPFGAPSAGGADRPLIRFVGGPVPVEAGEGKTKVEENPDEIALDDDDDDDEDGGQAGEGPTSEEKGCPDGCHSHSHDDAPAAQAAVEVENPDEVVLGDEEDEEGDAPMESNEDNDAEEAKEVEAMLIDSIGASSSTAPAAPASATAPGEATAPASATAPGEATAPEEANEETKEKDEEAEKRRKERDERGMATRFLALSKPGRGRDFLQIVDVPEAPSSSPSAPSASDPSARPSSPTLYFDPHWLSILRSTAPYLSLTPQSIPFPPLDELAKTIQADYEWVLQNVGKDGTGLVKVEEVQTFGRTAPTEQEWDQQGRIRMPSWYTNPQTLALTALLQIENKINPIPEGYLAALEAAKADEAKRLALEAAKAAAMAELELEAGEGGEGPSAGAGAGVVDEEPRGEHPDQVRRREQIVEEHAREKEAQAGGNPEEIAIEDDDDE